MLYNITSRFGLDYGEYEGEDEAHAFAALCRDAGYTVAVNDDGTLTFRNTCAAEECGQPSDWIITKVEE